MARFIAIPVAQGDAFYFERENLSVLIDGGSNQSAFATMFQGITRKNSVDIVVCTHNDADHSKGLIGYLESGLGCKEVWLPGRWLSVLPDVLKPFVDVFVKLVDNVSKTVEMANIVERPTDRLSLETYGENLQERLNEFDTEDRSERAAEDLGRDGWTETLVDMLERAEPWEEFWFRPWHRGDLDLIHSTYYWRLSPGQMQLAVFCD
jgi:hypothetical protein